MRLLFIITFAFMFGYGNSQAQNTKTDSLENLLSITTDTVQKIAILDALTWEFRNSDLKKSLDYGLRNIALIQQSQYPEKLPDTYGYVGIIYRNLGDYSQSMAYHYKALKLAKRYKIVSREAYSYNNIGDVLQRQNHFSAAITNIQKAIDLFTQLNHKKGQAYGYLRLGEVFKKQKRYREALEVFFKVLEIKSQPNADVSTVLQRIGNIYSKQGKYKEAILYLNKALNQDIITQDILGVCNVQNDMSAIYLQQNNPQKVIRQATKTWQKASEIMAKPIMYKTARLLQQAYEKQNNYIKAYYYQKQYIKTLEDFLNEQRGTQLDALKFSHQLEKQQVELDLKDKNIQLLKQAQKEHRLRQSLVYALFAAIVLLGGLITALVRGNLRKKKANRLLQNRNQEIAEKNHEIVVQNRELHIQQEEIQAQHNAIELRNRHITQSIQAAKTIQEAILPQQVRIKQMFAQYFVLYRPRDVVSGDFYWAGKVGNTRILGAIDCTGHGVPGAFMSLIGFALLNEIINTKKITNPAEILTMLRLEVKQALKQDETLNRDGMDAGLVAIEDQPDGKVKVDFAGAKRPLWYITKDSDAMQVVEGSRVSIGLTYKNKRAIENNTYILDKGTLLYLSSDGFVDQNKVTRDKFGVKRLTELIYTLSNQDLSEQKQALDEALDEFMAGTEQRDDILLMGVKL
ncbi:tetratricopeptide repeat protein [Microscilla marina]|nr:tetratricopeptide repeat protein [Microscilla marina]